MKLSPRFFMGVLVATVLFGGFAVIAFRGRPAIYTTPSGVLRTGTTGQPKDAAGTAQPQVLVFSMTQVSAHNTEQGCWTTIGGNVYDLTTWIPRHPGGPEVIIGMCGTDGTDAFNGQHSGSRRALSALGLLKIGTLK